MKIMIYGSWNIRCDRQKFLSFWAIFCPFSPLTTWKIKMLTLKKNTWRYYHFTHLHHKWLSYDVWFLRYGARQREFFAILDHFLPFYTPMDPENQNFKKMKKTPKDIIISQMCIKNDSHMMYISWDTECNTQNFLSFWTIFCPFTLLTNQNIKFWKNEKNDHLTLPKMTVTWCMVPEI